MSSLVRFQKDDNAMMSNPCLTYTTKMTKDLWRDHKIILTLVNYSKITQLTLFVLEIKMMSKSWNLIFYLTGETPISQMKEKF